ncbi:MAG: response regulator transcription factor [Eubacterium sp.]|nr:response regulator transcription factor [Eubacterium sp.]
MINISILDDEKIILDMVETLVRTTCNQRNDICIKTYTSAKDLLVDMEANVRFDIVISDIEMPEVNGIELGRRLKEKCPSAHLIYLTSYAEYAAESYIVAAYQYVMKSDVTKRLPTIINELLDKVEKEHKDYLILGTADDRKKVLHSDIICIVKEKGAKYAEYVTIEERLRERDSLENILETINSPMFVMADRGIVVNLKHIKRIAGNVIYLTDGTKVATSRRRLTVVKEALNNYWGCI